MNSPCSKLQGITSASLCIADKAEYNFTLNPSRAASSGEFKFKQNPKTVSLGRLGRRGKQRAAAESKRIFTDFCLRFTRRQCGGLVRR